jgi:glycosyltransferase involved in cell wall biosynthesis
MIKVICLIDSFNSGGAQKQMMLLANGLANKRFEVATLQYHDINFWSDSLDKRIIRFRGVHRNKFVRTIKVLYILYKYNPKYIISFLHIPNIYGMLYKLLFFLRPISLITSERNLNVNSLNLGDLLIRIPHLFATKVVCNSNSQKIKLEKCFGKKVLFITNGSYVENVKIKSYIKYDCRIFKFIVPARFSYQKNPINLLKALKIVLNKSDNSIFIYWFGRFNIHDKLYMIAVEFIKENNLEKNFIFETPTRDIYKKIIEYDAVILPSFYEGCPNAIIDGMLCGVPILASNVSDNRIYLKHQEEFLFDPSSPEDIAQKIQIFCRKGLLFRQQLGYKNRIYAEKYFNLEHMVKSYASLLTS